MILLYSKLDAAQKDAAPARTSKLIYRLANQPSIAKNAVCRRSAFIGDTCSGEHAGFADLAITGFSGSGNLALVVVN